MTSKEKIEILIDFLEKEYKNAKCSLIYDKPYELIIAARLSAQCTDKKVNSVTSKLFNRYKTIDSLAKASVEDVRNIIFPCGLSNKKASDIINICLRLIEKYNRKIPSKMEDLLTFSGVGRKTANLILAEIFKKPAIVVDTHFKRIINRLEIVCNKNPRIIELEVKKLILPEKSNAFCHRVICFGREICKSRRPLCNICKINKICNNFLI